MKSEFVQEIIERTMSV